MRTVRNSSHLPRGGSVSTTPSEQTHQDQAPPPPGLDTPWEQTPSLQGMLGYHLQCMLG